MAILEYNGHTQQVCLDEVSIQRTAIRHPSTDGILGHVETWTIAATLIGDTSSLLTQISSLVTAYAADGHDMTLKTAVGGTILAQLATASAAQGVKIETRPSFPTLANAEFITKRAYTIVAKAEYYDGNPNLLLDDQTTSFEIGQDEKAVRTVSGRLRTKDGVSAASYFASRDPGTPTGYTRGAKSYQKNHNDTEISYSYVDREHWQALPAGVLDGGYTISVQKTANETVKTISGRFVGPASARTAAINALRIPGRRLLNETLTQEPFAGATSFTLTYEYNHAPLVEFAESVEYVGALVRQIYQEVLGGGVPQRQEGAVTTARCIVSGRAVSRDSNYPTPPPLLYPAMYLVPGGLSFRYEAPTRGADGTYGGAAISWREEYEFPYDMGSRHPRRG